MIAQLRLDLPATCAGQGFISVIHGYTIKQVTERRLAIYDPAGHFVCHISSSDDPEEVIAIDQAHQARSVNKETAPS